MPFVPRRPLRLVTALVAASLVLGACRSGSSTGTQTGVAPTNEGSTTTQAAPVESRVGGTFRYALEGDPNSIDPRFVASDAGVAVVDALFDSLVAVDADLEVVPAAAESWTVSEDATTFEFVLREGATFHDGSPVRAEDFARTFHRMADGTTEPRSLVAYQLEPVLGFDEAQRSGVDLAGVEVVDDRTLRIILQRPFADFVAVLADPSLAPVPAAAEEDPLAFGESPIGNGPFKMAGAWQHNDFIRVARVPEYGDQPAYLEEIVFQIYADDPGNDDQFSEFQNGRLHFAEVPATQLSTAIEQYGISPDGYRGPGVLDGESATIYYYGFNTQQPPFDDPEVRRAISQLIDREAIVEEVTDQTREVADGIVPTAFPGHRDDACPYCLFDPEGARARIDGRETPIEGPLRILHNSGRTHEAIARRIARTIEDHLGVVVEVESRELPDFVQTLRAGEMGIFRLGWQADYPSPGSYLVPLFSSRTLGTDNLTRYATPEVDALLEEAGRELDDERRLELYGDAERRILEDAAVAPIFVYRHNRVVAPEVRDFVYNAMGRVDLSEVWLSPDL